MAVLCFACFAGVSLVKAVQGRATCGCFGSVEVSPTYTFVLDVVAVLALLWFRPTPGGRFDARSLLRRVRNLLVPAALTAVPIVVFVAWSLLRFGSVAWGWAYVEGAAVVPEAGTVHAGDVVAGMETVVCFRLRNLAATPVRVVGAQASCGCVAVDDLPLALPPGESADLSIRFTPPARDVGKTIRHYVLLALDVDHPPVSLWAKARVASRSVQRRAADQRN